MNRQTVQANFFVAAMLALGGGVLWRWQHNRAIATPAPPIRYDDSANGLRPAVEKEQVEARNAIEGQLKAFKQNDYNRAMSFQSMGLRGRFPNPNSLRMMITHFYPAFAHYKSANYGRVLSSIGEHPPGSNRGGGGKRLIDSRPLLFAQRKRTVSC